MKFVNDMGLVDETPCAGCGWPACSCLCEADDLVIDALRARANAVAEVERLKTQITRMNAAVNMAETDLGAAKREVERLRAQVEFVEQRSTETVKGLVETIRNEALSAYRLRAQVAELHDHLLTVWQFNSFSKEVGSGDIMPPSMIAGIVEALASSASDANTRQDAA